MKITCQSCQSKYNVADEKVQGKIVKIRCRKCGATIVVQGTGGAATNGSAAATGGASAVSDTDSPQWHVNLAEGEPKTMTLADLADACKAGTVPLDTFIWTDGMDDWKPVTDVEAVMAAISGGTSPAAGGGFEPPAAEPAFQSSLDEGSGDGGREPAPALVAAASFEAPVEAPEPRRAAVAKREARGRDLFGSGGGEEVQTSAPAVPHAMAPALGDVAGRPTGERNENSVLFSLAVLTKDAGDRPPEDEAPKSSGRSTEDSGLIDLKALAAKAESMRPASSFADGGAFAAPLGFAPPAVGALGSPLGDAPAKSKLPLFIGGGAGVALLLVLGIVIGVKLGGSGSAAAASAAPPPPPTMTTAEPAPTVTATAEASATATATASAAPKPKPYAGGGGTYHPPSGGGTKPAGAATAAGNNAAPPPPPTPPPPKKAGSDCGCNGDSMCLMKCSTH